MKRLPIHPKPNIVINVKGLTAEELEEKMNALEARNYHRSYGLEPDGLMLFHYYEPRPVRDFGETMELVGKISRRYLAWHGQKRLGKRATERQVEYFVRSSRLAYPDGSPITSTELRMVHTNVNLILRATPKSKN